MVCPGKVQSRWESESDKSDQCLYSSIIYMNTPSFLCADINMDGRFTNFKSNKQALITLADAETELKQKN